jgi:hypothetical protein
LVKACTSPELSFDWLPMATVSTEELRGVRVFLVSSTANLKAGKDNENIFENKKIIILSVRPVTEY